MTTDEATGRPPTITHPDEVDEPERLLMEREVEFAAAERMTFFSDAVVAIAVTLLALELPVPEGTTTREILHNAGESFNEYLAFVISFFVIAFHWRTHHRVFRYVDQVTGRVITLNMFWLFLIVITPFITKFLNSGPINLLRFGTYAGVETIQYALFIVMVVMIMRSDFVKPGTDLQHFRNTIRNIVPVAIGFGVSIPVFWLFASLPELGIDQNFAFVIWGVLPTLLGFGGRYLRYRRDKTPKPTSP